MVQASDYRRRFPDLPEPDYEPLVFKRYPVEEMLVRARARYEECERRRTTRHFSSEPVPRELITSAIRTANTAPSGAHIQPWQFCCNRRCLPETTDPGSRGSGRVQVLYRAYDRRMATRTRQIGYRLGENAYHRRPVAGGVIPATVSVESRRYAAQKLLRPRRA